MEEEIDFPPHFRCPISMELMTDPVTISTGVTYDRRSIEKWLFSYGKPTCPATMLPVDAPHLTPNHTLRRLILAWKDGRPPPPPPPALQTELAALLDAVETAPFKVASLKKLRALLERTGEEGRARFLRAGGVDTVVRVLSQVATSADAADFLMFRSCEEALGVLHQLPLPLSGDDDREVIRSLSEPETVRSVAVMLQRGGAEARFQAVTMLRSVIKLERDGRSPLIQDEKLGLDIIRPLLELVSDDVCARASSRALEVMIGMLEASKRSRVKAVEAGAVRVLVELLPESGGRSKCEKILLLIKLLCGCAEGRHSLAEHGMGIAAVSKKLAAVSDWASSAGVKVMWLMGVFHPTERVVEDMMVFGAAQKLVELLRSGGGDGEGSRRLRPSMKEKAVKVLRLHGGHWMRHPCCPNELKACLGTAGGRP